MNKVLWEINSTLHLTPLVLSHFVVLQPVSEITMIMLMYHEVTQVSVKVRKATKSLQISPNYKNVLELETQNLSLPILHFVPSTGEHHTY